MPAPIFWFNRRSPGKLGNEMTQDDVRQEMIEADADLLDS